MRRFITSVRGGLQIRWHLRRCGALWLMSAFMLMAGSQAWAQVDDPDGLLVPPGLEKLAESPPADDTADNAASPRTEIGDDLETEIIGKVVSVEDRVLTIRDGDDRMRKLRIVKNARIVLDDKRARLQDLRPGDAVRLKTGGDPVSASAVRAVSPPPSSDREPDMELRQRRQAELQNEDDAQNQQQMQTQRQHAGNPQGGGRVWMVMMDAAGGAAEAGMRPGDVILIVDSEMVQSEKVLNRFNLPSGLFPLQSNANGEVFVGPNGVGVGIRGPGGVLVPTGVNLRNGGFGLNGVNANPNGFAPTVRRQGPLNDNNFGPPIGGGSDSADRNFGPPIGTGNSATPQPPANPTPDGAGVAPRTTGGPSSPTPGTGGAASKATN